MQKIQILGISGSLRPDSTNTVILRAFGSLLPSSYDFQLFEGLGEMPHFNPDLDDTAAVIRFKQAVEQSHAIVICTPEYAFGVPGTLKNALDWTVATGEFNAKPVAAITASPLNSGGNNALASLMLTLTALGTRHNEESLLSIPNVKRKLANRNVADVELLIVLRKQCDNLLALVN